MKKLIFPLLLMLAIGMLAAVESDPSNVVGYVKYPMVVGYNAAALPMDQGLTNTTEIGLIFEDDVNTIMVWNQDAQGWDAAVNYYGGFWDPEFDVQIGTPLYLTVDNAFDWPSRAALNNSLFKTKF